MLMSAEFGPARAPFGQLPARLGQHPISQRHDHPDFLGQRNELQRRNHSAPRMLPAHQGLKADRLAG